MSVFTEVTATTATQESSVGISLPPNSQKRNFEIDDPVWLTDPVVGILQGVVVHVDTTHIGIQLTGASLGKGNRKRIHPQRGLGLLVAKRNFVSASVDQVYKRSLRGQENADGLSTEKILNRLIEQRQSTLMTRKYVHEAKSSWSPLYWFRKQPGMELEAAESVDPSRPRSALSYATKRSLVCSEDLHFIESLLLPNQLLAFCLWDPCLPQASTVWASAAFAHLTGIPVQSILQRNLDSLIGEQTDAAHTSAWQQAFRQQSPCHMVAVHYRPGGQAFYHRLFLTPLCDDKKQIRYYLSLHGEVSPTEAGRINRHEGWPMPAIFNLKDQGETAFSEEPKEFKGDLSKTDAYLERITEPAPPSPLPGKDDEKLPDISAWLPEFSAHEKNEPEPPKSPKKKTSSRSRSPKPRRHSKKKKSLSSSVSMENSSSSLQLSSVASPMDSPRKERPRKNKKSSASSSSLQSSQDLSNQGHSHPFDAPQTPTPKTPRSKKSKPKSSESPKKKKKPLASPRKSTSPPRKPLHISTAEKTVNSGSSAVSDGAIQQRRLSTGMVAANCGSSVSSERNLQSIPRRGSTGMAPMNFERSIVSAEKSPNGSTKPRQRSPPRSLSGRLSPQKGKGSAQSHASVNSSQKSQSSLRTPTPRQTRNGSMSPAPRQVRKSSLSPAPRQVRKGSVSPAPRQVRKGSMSPAPRRKGSMSPAPRQVRQGSMSPKTSRRKMAPPLEKSEADETTDRGTPRRKSNEEMTENRTRGPAPPRRNSGKKPLPQNSGVQNTPASNRTANASVIDDEASTLSPYQKPRAFNDIGWTAEAASSLHKSADKSIGSEAASQSVGAKSFSTKTKDKPVAETVESDSDSSDSNEDKSDYMGLFRGNSIGDLHNVLFSNTPTLSNSTHHTMTSFSEDAEADHIFIDNCAEQILEAPHSPGEESHHSDASISDVHNVLYNQPTPSLGVTQHSLLPML